MQSRVKKKVYFQHKASVVETLRLKSTFCTLFFYNTVYNSRCKLYIVILQHVSCHRTKLLQKRIPCPARFKHAKCDITFQNARANMLLIQSMKIYVDFLNTDQERDACCKYVQEQELPKQSEIFHKLVILLKLCYSHNNDARLYIFTHVYAKKCRLTWIYIYWTFLQKKSLSSFLVLILGFCTVSNYEQFCENCALNMYEYIYINIYIHTKIISWLQSIDMPHNYNTSASGTER